MSRIVPISASTAYDVEIAEGLLSRLGTKAAELIKGRNACVVTDRTVAGLYLSAASVSLRDAGFLVTDFVFPDGESSKTIQTYGSLLETLARNGLGRDDVIIALGGGVTGDLAGFAAATYQRGIPYIQVPTSLLAMVDSSVGGKTAIDLEAGKNLAGAFYPPQYVLCDPALLKTLSPQFTADGWAEIVKYAVLASPQLFSHLENACQNLSLPEIIETCVQIKHQYVMQDEFDTGIRQLLNLGHTIGHSIEACSGFTITHGQAVSTGLAMVARACASFELCNKETSEKIQCLLTRYNLPVHTNFPSEDLCEAALKDKKRSGSTLTLIIPREIGHCERHCIPVHELMHWLQAGM